MISTGSCALYVLPSINITDTQLIDNPYKNISARSMGGICILFIGWVCGLFGVGNWVRGNEDGKIDSGWRGEVIGGLRDVR